MSQGDHRIRRGIEKAVMHGGPPHHEDESMRGEGQKFW
jgi:hypothetical protein